MTTGYCPCALTELIKGQIASKVSVEEFHYPRHFDAASTAKVNEADDDEDYGENYSRGDDT